MRKKDKPTWVVRLNVDGFSIMTARTSEEHAKRIAKQFDLPWGSNAISRWPLTIHKIGHEVELEQKIMATVLSPKMVVPKGETLLFLVGRVRAGAGDATGSNDEWGTLDQAIKQIYEETENKAGMEWSLLTAKEGTAVPQFNRKPGE